MKIIKLIALSGLAAFSLAACGGDTQDEATQMVDKAKDKVETTETAEIDTSQSNVAANFTKADYMKACTSAGSSEAQCNCTVDFYESLGVEVSDLRDQAKLTEVMNNAQPEQMIKLAAVTSRFLNRLILEAPELVSGAFIG